MVWFPISRAFATVGAAAAVVAVTMVVLRVVAAHQGGTAATDDSRDRATAIRQKAREKKERLAPGSPAASSARPTAPASPSQAAVAEAATHEPQAAEDDEMDSLLRPLWSDPGAEGFQVRGANYLADRVKVPSDAAPFRLDHVDVFETPATTYDICNADPRAARRARMCSEGGTRAVIAMNLQIPGSPPIAIVIYWSREGLVEPPAETGPGAEADTGAKLGWMLSRLWHGDDAFRKSRFKFVPIIKDGPLAVKAVVASKPVILGNKIDVPYYRDGSRLLEIDVDVGSSSVASAITSVCRGAARQFSLNVAMVVQGEAPEELPERVIGCANIAYLDVELRKPPLSSLSS